MLKTGKNKNHLAIAASIVVLLIFLHFFRITQPAESFIVYAFRPVLSKFYSASAYIRSKYYEQTKKGDLLAEIDELQKYANELIIRNSRLQALEEENAVLRQYLGFASTTQAKLIMADIISGGEPESGNEQVIMIGKGSKDGLYPGLAVVSSQGVIVGKLVEVKESSSSACLSTNQRCKFAATTEKLDSTTGIVEGDLGLTIKMGFIPQTKEIKVGDIVITSGLEKNIPRGLVVGLVSKVVRESNELWQSATIEPLAEPATLRVVSVLLP